MIRIICPSNYVSAAAIPATSSDVQPELICYVSIDANWASTLALGRLTLLWLEGQAGPGTY